MRAVMPVTRRSFLLAVSAALGVAGRAASGQFEGLQVGSVLKSGQFTWSVVGIFESSDSVAEYSLQ